MSSRERNGMVREARGAGWKREEFSPVVRERILAPARSGAACLTANLELEVFRAGDRVEAVRRDFAEAEGAIELLRIPHLRRRVEPHTPVPRFHHGAGGGLSEAAVVDR